MFLRSWSRDLVFHVSILQMLRSDTYCLSVVGITPAMKCRRDPKMHLSCPKKHKSPSKNTIFIPCEPFLYDLGFSFFSFHKADRPTPETLTTLKRTPGISPLALPFRPKPARRTSSFSSTKLRQPSFGTVTQPVSHAILWLACPNLSMLHISSSSLVATLKIPFLM